ncbi:RNA recognition motif, partial [Trifolium medium]|nr:RNA recognition motif [Trifolium medium]
EREREVSRRGRSRGRSSNRRSHGYIHNVDQSSISFFVTNFPEDSTVEEIWQLFARFGRVRDVYIPSKVDKWGNKFAFVKFREVKEVGELSQSMKDVWLGSFKLRINKSRFDRKEGDKRKEEVGRVKATVDGGVNNSFGRSFKIVMVQSTSSQEVLHKCNVVEEEALQVEVDDRVLKEFELSFVGKLAVSVEMRRIKTTLYMEGFLIFRPWSPASFVDRRVTWVKVYGIPLHVWGENLFKAIGGKYGEFLDFDYDMASRAKLDVARIKIATDFRGSIDNLLRIKALGTFYSLRIVEEKEMEQAWYH